MVRPRKWEIMNSLAKRATFDATLDEFAEVQVRIIRQTHTARSWRRNAVAVNFGIVSAAIFAGLWLAGKLGPSVEYLTRGLLIALAIGAVWAYFYRRSYDQTVTKRTRRLLEEQLGGPGPFTCEVELQPDGAWTRCQNTELRIPWTNATGVTDTDKGIEIAFRTGLILIRNRAFESGSDRREFFELARVLAAKATPR